MIGKRGAADRHGRETGRGSVAIGPPLTAARIFSAAAATDLGRAMRQDDAEAVAAEPADQVADAQASVEPAADLDQHGVGRLVAKCVVDHRHVVDPDRQEGGRGLLALIAAMIWSTASRSRLRLKWPVSSS